MWAGKNSKDMDCEQIGDLSYRFTFKFPAEKVREEVEKRLKAMSGEVKMDGFRPGNAPMNLVREKYTSSVTQDVLEDTLRDHFIQAVKDKGIKPVAAPRFVQDPKGGDADTYAYVAEVEVMPEFKLADLTHLKVDKPRADVSDADVDKIVERLRRQTATYRPVVRPAADGDRVLVEFERASDAQMLGFGDDAPYHLPVIDKPDAFTQPLVGAIAGDRCTLMKPGAEGKPKEKSRIILPGQTQPAASDDEIVVIAKDVQESVLPEVDKTFLEQFKVDDIDELRKRLRASAEYELARRLHTMFKDALIKVVLDSHDIPLPQAMVQEQVSALREDLMQRMGIKEMPTGNDDLLKPQAERSVKLSIVMSKIMETHADALRVERSEVDEKLKMIADQQENPAEIIEHYQKDENARHQIEQMVLEDKLFSWLEGQVTVTETQRSFDEVMS